MFCRAEFYGLIEADAEMHPDTYRLRKIRRF